MRALLLAVLIALPALPVRAEGLSRRERLSLAADAQALFLDKKFAVAAEALEKASAPGAAKKDLAQWLPALGRCHEALKNYQRALSAYQQARDLQPKSVDRMLDLARVYALVDLNDKAIELYESVLERQKDRRDVMLALASLYFESERLEPAREQAERYVRWEPRDLSAQRLLARIEEASGNLASAARRRQEALAQEPSAREFYDVGLLWMRQGEHELADSDFRRAEGLGMTSAVLPLQRGLLAWQRGDDKAAAAFWTQSLEKDPRLSMAGFLLALSDRRAGRIGSALKRMRQVEAQTSSDYIKGLARDFLAALEKDGSGERQ